MSAAAGERPLSDHPCTAAELECPTTGKRGQCGVVYVWPPQ